MSDDPHNMRRIPIGTPVVALNGEVLGTVRETHPHYLLVDQPEAHNDLDIPAHAVRGLVDGTVQLSINRTAATEVDHEETVHHEHGDPTSGGGC
jgi:hypothetical protein